jgi:hypothetical protein
MYSDKLSDSVQPEKLWTCTRDMPSSISVEAPKNFTEVFPRFPQSLQANSRTIFQLGHKFFLPPQFIGHSHPMTQRC